VDIKITGLDELQRKLSRAAKAASPSEQARRIRGTRCPDHGQAPTNVRVIGDRVTAEFCCAKARDRAMKASTDQITRALR
jgi:hypothetical protein